MTLNNIDNSSWSVSPSRYVGTEKENIESAEIEDLIKGYYKLDNKTKELEKNLNQNLKKIKDLIWL